jgi:hypothetical protein
VDARATSAAVGARFTVQNPVAPQADKSPTRFILQRAKELVVAILAIAHDQMELLGHLCPPVSAQLLDL